MPPLALCGEQTPHDWPIQLEDKANRYAICITRWHRKALRGDGFQLIFLFPRIQHLFPDKYGYILQIAGLRQVVPNVLHLCEDLVH